MSCGCAPESCVPVSFGNINRSALFSMLLLPNENDEIGQCILLTMMSTPKLFGR